MQHTLLLISLSLSILAKIGLTYLNTPTFNETPIPHLSNYQTKLLLKFHLQFNYYTNDSLQKLKKILYNMEKWKIEDMASIQELASKFLVLALEWPKAEHKVCGIPQMKF